MEPTSGNPAPVEAATAEKRKHLRLPLRVLRVETELRGEVFFGHATNISKTGLFIQTTNPRPVGFQIKIRFEMPRFKKKIQCMAEVVWAQEFTGEKGIEPGMGLKFLDLAPEELQMLDRFVEEKTGERKI
ncbi:MAG: PilZ domain-containing protein [Pseudomonadota bacterium]